MWDEGPAAPPTHSPFTALVEREGLPVSAKACSHVLLLLGSANLIIAGENAPISTGGQGHHMKCPMDATSHFV